MAAEKISMDGFWPYSKYTKSAKKRLGRIPNDERRKGDQDEFSRMC